MRSEFLVEKDPWAIAREAIQSGDLGRIAEVCVQHSMEPDQSDADWSRWLARWQEELVDLFGPVTSSSIRQTPRSCSMLAAFGEGPILRLFGDSRPDVATPSIGFEVVGQTKTLIHRPFGGVLSVVCGGAERPDMVSPVGVQETVSVEQAGLPAGQTRLGIMSLAHPHAVGNHMPGLKMITDTVSVVGVADDDASRVEPWQAAFSACHYGSKDALLADPNVDAVLITSENCDHATDVIAAAKAGKDILCDKPIATTRDDVHRLVDAVGQAGVRFVTTYPLRSRPAVRSLRESILRGDMGTIESIAATNHGCMYEPGTPAWVRDPRRNGGGCIVDHTVHVADMIRWLTGAEFAEVQALAGTRLREMEAEDIGVMHGVMTDDTLFQIDASWSRKASDPSWGDVTVRVVGTKGSASLDLYNNLCVEIYTPDGIEKRYPNFLTYDHAMIFLEYHRERITGDRGHNADAIDGLRSLELVFAAYESIEAEQAVEVKRHTPAT